MRSLPSYWIAARPPQPPQCPQVDQPCQRAVERAFFAPAGGVDRAIVRPDVNLSFVPLDWGAVDRLLRAKFPPITFGHHSGRAGGACLVAPWLLPHLRFAVQVDTDVVFGVDIAHLWAQLCRFDGQQAAAQARELGRAPLAQHNVWSSYNFGVTLLHLDRWRQLLDRVRAADLQRYACSYALTRPVSPLDSLDCHDVRGKHRLFVAQVCCAARAGAAGPPGRPGGKGRGSSGAGGRRRPAWRPRRQGRGQFRGGRALPARLAAPAARAGAVQGRAGPATTRDHGVCEWDACRPGIGPSTGACGAQSLYRTIPKLHK